jgi:hypothetical protein
MLQLLSDDSSTRVRHLRKLQLECRFRSTCRFPQKGRNEMELLHIIEDSRRNLRSLFPGEEIACHGIFWATILTLMVLFQLSMIW